MACVTLKRPIDVLGSPHEHQPLTKRKRCGPPLFPSTPPCSPSRGVKRAKRKLSEWDDHYTTPVSSPTPSPFVSATPPLERGKLVFHLEQELKRLQRRKLFTQEVTSTSISSQSSGSTSPQSSSREQPLFTLKQVTIVCQRMLREREEQIKAEYDKLLSAKLSDQYDAFVKFNHDQVERRLKESDFSYVS